MNSNTPFAGQKIALRPFSSDDTATLTYLNHPELSERRYVPWKFSNTLPLSHKQLEAICQQWMEKEDGFNLAVVRQDNQQLIGHAECEWGWDPHCPSLSLVIAPAQQRQGYGGETLQLLLNYLFGYTLAHHVACWVADWNQAARSFLGRYGFKEDGRSRQVSIYQGQFYDVVVASILRPEWKGMSHVVGR